MSKFPLGSFHFFFFSVYTKFAQLYASLGVCSMRYSHKIHACRQVIGASSSRIKLVVEEHLTKPCMRRTVDLGDGPGEDTTKTSELYLSQCPPTIIEGLSKELRQTTIFYIASNASPRSVELFSRHNVPGEKIKPVNVAYNLDVRSMEQEKQRAKLFPNILILAGKTRKSASAESAYQNKKKLINMLNQSPVRTPAALQRQLNQISERRRQKKLTETMRLTHGISMVERALIEFSQVKINIFGMSQIFKLAFSGAQKQDTKRCSRVELHFVGQHPFSTPQKTKHRSKLLIHVLQ